MLADNIYEDAYLASTYKKMHDTLQGCPKDMSDLSLWRHAWLPNKNPEQKTSTFLMRQLLLTGIKKYLSLASGYRSQNKERIKTL